MSNAVVNACQPPARPDGLAWPGEEMIMDRIAPDASRFGLAFKTFLERLAAVLMLLSAAPLMLLLALAVKLDSPGPALFVQPRYGRMSRRFGMLKFRTMRVDACDVTGGNQTERKDPRITRVGWFLRRTSLDELPQLLNVIRGDMALVGPRAHPCGMRVNGRLCEEIVPNYMQRHLVRPGITGLAQVSGSRGPVETEAQLRERLALDLTYIARWTPWLDATIVFRTIGACLRRTNAY
jgi:lipopolysaccharide/colanic/teichoic acid biosynthesis glycosyltransferase